MKERLCIYAMRAQQREGFTSPLLWSIKIDETWRRRILEFICIWFWVTRDSDCVTPLFILRMILQSNSKKKQQKKQNKKKKKRAQHICEGWLGSWSIETTGRWDFWLLTSQTRTRQPKNSNDKTSSLSSVTSSPDSSVLNLCNYHVPIFFFCLIVKTC